MSNYIDKPILVIDESCMYKVKVEDVNDLDKSYFKDAYATAFKILNEIIIENDKFNDNQCSLNCKYLENGQNSDNCSNYKGKDQKSGLDFDVAINNIISFVGERGSGKTSAMKSFVKMIKSLRTKSVSNNIIIENIEKFHKSFYITDLIDPSTFSKNESIIEIIIAELFKAFKYNENCEMYEKQEILKCFEKVFKDLRVLNKEKSKVFEDNFDNIDILLNLSSAISLKGNLYELIKRILKIEHSNYLIIQIDDLDMNISAGAKMLEDLRKYLNLPNVIIIMAAKYTQLFEVVKQENIKYMGELCKYAKNMEGEKEVFAEEINNKTDKYLEKLIPVSRRIYLPEVSINNTNVILNLGINADNRNRANSEPENVSIKIRRLFYEKLRIVIVTNKAAESIIPKNLRSFIEFVKLLDDLENVNDKKIVDGKEYIELNKAVLKNNIDKFKNMINEGYVFADYGVSKYKINRMLYCEINQLNRLIVEFLNEQILKSINGYDDNENKWREYIDYVRKSRIYLKQYNISYGDIITWVAIYEGLNIEEKEKRLIEIVKIIYSIRLIEALLEDDFNIDKINGPDFIGNYFNIKGGRDIRFTKPFSEQVEFLENKNINFNVNITNKKFDKIVEYYKEQKNRPELEEVKRNIGNDDSKLYNIPLSSLIDLKKIFDSQEQDRKDTILENQFEILFENIYYYYSSLEYRYPNPLGRLSADDKYYNIYENREIILGFHRKYYFKAFNIILCHIFKKDMYESFCDNLDIYKSSSFFPYENERFNILIYLFNVDFFMNVLSESTKNLSRKRPGKGYESRLDFWLKIVLNRILDEISIQYNEFRKVSADKDDKDGKSKDTIKNILDDLKKICNETSGIIPFILQNIFLDSTGAGILGNINKKSDLIIDGQKDTIDNINIMINYIEKKRSNNTTAGSSIDGQLRAYLKGMLNAAPDDLIIKEYHKSLSEIRKKFIGTVADTDERNRVADEFILKLNELKEKLS